MDFDGYVGFNRGGEGKGHINQRESLKLGHIGRNETAHFQDGEETSLAPLEGKFLEVVGNYYIQVIGTTPTSIPERASKEAVKNLQRQTEKIRLDEVELRNPLKVIT